MHFTRMNKTLLIICAIEISGPKYLEKMMIITKQETAQIDSDACNDLEGQVLCAIK